MKTAIWLYLFTFVALFDLHAQYPVLSPFALSLGAAPSFIGFIMGAYSITHLPGNLLAGYGVDRFGSRLFIIFSLVLAGIALLFQSRIADPWQLLLVRSLSGFVLAFLSPACMALLAKIARDRIHQGKLMAGNGLVHTAASVISPAAGAYLVAKVGFTACFTILGWVLIFTGLFASFGIRDVQAVPKVDLRRQPAAAGEKGHLAAGGVTDAQIPWFFFVIPLAISCSQGILFFELPLIHPARDAIMSSGLLFSIVSLGALLTLSMMFLNRLSSFSRTAGGSIILALVFFCMAIGWPFPLVVNLLLIGMAQGVVFPAMSTLLAEITDNGRYGRVFSILSVSFAIGAFIGPVAAGQVRNFISPYYVAFLTLMIAVALMPFAGFRLMKPSKA